MGKLERHLILGGARSGKSRYAERLAMAQPLPVTYIATAQGKDEEMRQRILHHQTQRPAHWQTLETPVELADALQTVPTNQLVIVDCLTLWLLNCMEAARMDAVEHFLEAVCQPRQPLIFVSNEIGMGVVPADRLSRRFVDELGRLHQRMAAIVEQVTLMVAGYPLKVKTDDKTT